MLDLQFAVLRTVGCVLHQSASQVIHRPELCEYSSPIRSTMRQRMLTSLCVPPPLLLCEHSSFPLFPWWRLPLSATFVDARVGQRARVGLNARRFAGRGNNKKKRGNFDRSRMRTLIGSRGMRASWCCIWRRIQRAQRL